MMRKQIHQSMAFSAAAAELIIQNFYTDGRVIFLDSVLPRICHMPVAYTRSSRLNLHNKYIHPALQSVLIMYAKGWLDS